jgi:hypothetical protein
METVKAVPKGELPCPFLRDAQADESPTVPRHEVDRLGRYVVGRYRQVALILPILIIDENDHLPGTNVVESLFDCRKSHAGFRLSMRTRVF